MRFVKVLALIVGSVLLIPVLMLLIGVVFQSVLGAVAVFILLLSFWGISHDRVFRNHRDRVAFNARLHPKSPDQDDPPEFYGTGF